MRGQDRDLERADAVIELLKQYRGAPENEGKTSEWVEIAGAMCREG